MRWRTNSDPPLAWQWAQPGQRRLGNFIKSPTTSQRTPRVTALVTAAVVPPVLYSSTVIEISPTPINNMPIVPPDPCLPPIPTSVLQTYSRDNRNARDSLTARPNLAPSRSMRQVGTSLRSTAESVAGCGDEEAGAPHRSGDGDRRRWKRLPWRRAVSWTGIEVSPRQVCSMLINAVLARTASFVLNGIDYGLDRTYGVWPTHNFPLRAE
jgi:hypothetical protein